MIRVNGRQKCEGRNAKESGTSQRIRDESGTVTLDCLCPKTISDPSAFPLNVPIPVYPVRSIARCHFTQLVQAEASLPRIPTGSLQSSSSNRLTILALLPPVAL